MRTVLLLVLFLFVPVCFSGTSDFEGLSYPAGADYWNGSDGSGGFSDGGAYFVNDYNYDYSSWSGWSYSRVTDNVTSGWGNQYSSAAGSGVNGSESYGVSYAGFGSLVQFDVLSSVEGAYFTNSTYTYYSMRDGDNFAKKFGGSDGSDEDWFLLTVSGYNDGALTDTVEIYLADFRFADSGDDYILDEWKWFDLSGLGEVDEVSFSLSSSDVGAFGMNTPAYFVMDSLVSVPEPMSIFVLSVGGFVLGFKRS
jgi:hypothetical protein